MVLIGSKKLLEKQMLKLGFNYKINEVKKDEIINLNLKKDSINIINSNFKFKKTFDSLNKSSKYIENSFKISLDILKK